MHKLDFSLHKHQGNLFVCVCETLKRNNRTRTHIRTMEDAAVVVSVAVQWHKGDGGGRGSGKGVDRN